MVDMTKLPTRVMEFKEFEAAFNATRKLNIAARRQAEGTLSPAMIERALRNKSGVAVPGEKQGEGYYSNEELQVFRRLIKRIQDETGGQETRGAYAKQILGLSRDIDVERANTQIPYARLYRVRGGTLSFSVKASGLSGFDGYYKVRVRLEGWDSALVSGQRWPIAAKKAAQGRISFDCQCGRHQFWYRYLAGIGGFAIEPPSEKDFPKIRNPTLDGAACKHVIKTIQTLQSPTVQSVLADELKRQAGSVGYNKVTTKYLNQADHEKLSRARVRKTNKASAAAEYRDYLESTKGLKKAAITAQKRTKKQVDLEQEAKILKAKNQLANQRLKQKEEENQRLANEALVSKLSAELNRYKMEAVMAAAMSGRDPMKAATQALADFPSIYAGKNNMQPNEIKKIIEDNNL